tara:strand:- start:65 stop:496 length:432 start_codon:yes stop_codon:yes gene_type:complete
MKIQKTQTNTILLSPSIGELIGSSFLFLISIFLLDSQVLISILIFFLINLFTGFFLLKRTKIELNDSSGELTIRRYLFYFIEYKKIESKPSNFQIELVDSQTKNEISYVHCKLNENEINLGTLYSKNSKKELKKSLVSFGIEF